MWQGAQQDLAKTGQNSSPLPYFFLSKLKYQDNAGVGGLFFPDFETMLRLQCCRTESLRQKYDARRLYLAEQVRVMLIVRGAER